MISATRSDSRLVSAVRRRSVLRYFLLTFAISWGGILIVVVSGGFVQTRTELGALFLPIFLVMLLGPSLAGLIPPTALRLLIVGLYQRTQSGLIAALTHAGYTSALMVLWPTGTSPTERLAP